jgi:hypothetical protein
MSDTFPTAEKIAAEKGATPTAEQLAAVNIYQARREEHHDNPTEATRAAIIEAAHAVERAGWIPLGHTLASEVL